MPGGAIDFSGVGVLKPNDVAGKFDHGALQTEADAEKWDAALAGVTDGLDLARNAAVAKTAGDQQAIDAAQHPFGPFALDVFALNFAHDHIRRQRDAGVGKRLVDRLVGIVMLDVLADNG